MNVSTENEAYAYDGQRVYIGGMRIVLYRLTPISKEDTEKIYRFGYNPFREYGEAVNIDKKNNKSMCISFENYKYQSRVFKTNSTLIKTCTVNLKRDVLMMELAIINKINPEFYYECEDNFFYNYNNYEVNEDGKSLKNITFTLNLQDTESDKYITLKKAIKVDTNDKKFFKKVYAKHHAVDVSYIDSYEFSVTNMNYDKILAICNSHIIFNENQLFYDNYGILIQLRKYGLPKEFLLKIDGNNTGFCIENVFYDSKGKLVGPIYSSAS